MVSWRRNLYAIWGCQVLSMTGFGFVLPFLPFYIQELGVTGPAELRAWTGAISGAPGLLMGVAAPIWGRLADRYGRRLMVLRAMAAGSLSMLAISFAPNVQTVFALRMLQGLFTGTVAASSTLVAATTPRGEISYAMGLIASASFIGNALGPSIGGLAAEWLGYRPTFLIGAAITATGFLLVLLLVEEAEARTESDEAGEESGVEFQVQMTFRSPFFALFLIFFVLRFARALPGSFLSLYIQELRGTISGASALTGALSAVTALATGLAGLLLGPLGDRHDRLRLLTLFTALGAAFALPMFLAPGAWSFAAFYVASAFFLGPTNPLLESTMTVMTARSTRGVLFGVEAFMGSMAMATAPMAGSVVSIGFGLKHIFLVFALVLAAGCGIAEAGRRSVSRSYRGAVSFSSRSSRASASSRESPHISPEG